MSSIVIRNGTLLDTDGPRRGDIGVVDGTVVAAADVSVSSTDVDATDCIVTTGLVDLHAHLGEPGDEVAETMVSGIGDPPFAWDVSTTDRRGRVGVL